MEEREDFYCSTCFVHCADCRGKLVKILITRCGAVRLESLLRSFSLLQHYSSSFLELNWSD